jgi:hypothetical protein
MNFLPLELFTLVCEHVHEPDDVIAFMASCRQAYESFQYIPTHCQERFFQRALSYHKKSPYTVLANAVAKPIRFEFTDLIMVIDFEPREGTSVHLLSKVVYMDGVPMQPDQLTTTTTILQPSMCVRFQGNWYFDMMRLVSLFHLVVKVGPLCFRPIGSMCNMLCEHARKQSRLSCYMSREFEVIRMIPRVEIF